ncbi:putative virulence factor [Stutzerimonas stutzeri]|uniref:putative virulence factor n=1 Tax=Stutzerimonas stutzeri TaxID=316 RepID=UPI002109FCBF|nr:putative virulence factor [Stutzerimonas stutzeri]MCQ4240923.1 putative virulence factor [Stutzerimonas stutzeri]
MSNLTPKQIQLSTSWAAIHEGAGQALEWIREVRGNAPRLDSEADSFNLKLHRARNLARSLGRVAGTPMTIGFFGLSQAGKSYLISALAANQQGKLETLYGDTRLDFIKHVNPPGGGKEATGLVTRFSRTAKSGPASHPVELKLFSEIELAKILANAWFNDFNQELVDYELDEPRIARILKPFENGATNAPQAGVSADDVVSLWDYLRDNFEKSIRKLEHLYWPRAMELAPRLSCTQRAELFSILWGEQPELTNLYIQLASTLQRLGHAPRVFAPLSVLVSRDGDGYSQRDSIMNVDMLERLGSSRDLPVEVCPAPGDNLLPVVGVPVVQLAALTAEMIFPLVNPTCDPQVEQVDLLDFPGYRGRLGIRSVSEAGSQASAQGGNPVSQLLLRGKVAYLFERYTDSQEMNSLVVCTSSSKQIDVKDVGPVLTRWIEKTQGATVQERGKRTPGLIWALTMFDMQIGTMLEQDENMVREGWEGLLKKTMLERFGQYEWIQNWAGQPFSNTYLVRKPRLPMATFVEMAEHTYDELGMVSRYQAQLQLLGRTFVDAPAVCEHIAQPDEAWAAMMALNDGGIQRISQYLGRVAHLDFKLNRIEEQLERCKDDLLHSLDGWYHKDGEGALALKRAQAQMILQDLGRRLPVLGELIDHLQLPGDSVRDLYLSGAYEVEENATESTEEAAQAAPQSLYGNDGGFDFGEVFGSAETPAAKVAAPQQQSSEHRFARAVFKAWISHLREIANRQNLLTLLGLDRKVVEAVVDELITAAYRLDVPEQISRALLLRTQSGTRRDQLVQRQVLTVQLVLRDYVSWFGNLHKPVDARPKSLIGSKDHLFAFYRHPQPGQLPELPVQPIDQSRLFLGDWLSGLACITQDNAGHSAGREITIEQNEWLGRVLQSFQAR